MATLFIRDFPEELHSRARIQAYNERIGLRDLFAKAILLYLDGSPKPGQAKTEYDPLKGIPGSGYPKQED